jgi:hypothetical protein
MQDGAYLIGERDQAGPVECVGESGSFIPHRAPS